MDADRALYEHAGHVMVACEEYYSDDIDRDLLKELALLYEQARIVRHKLRTLGGPGGEVAPPPE